MAPLKGRLQRLLQATEKDREALELEEVFKAGMDKVKGKRLDQHPRSIDPAFDGTFYDTMELEGGGAFADVEDLSE